MNTAVKSHFRASNNAAKAVIQGCYMDEDKEDGKDEEDDMSLTYVIGITGDNGISLMGFVYCTTSV